MKRFLVLSFGLLISALFLWLLLRDKDIAGLGRVFGNLSLGHLVLALGFLAAGFSARIVRWWFMLRELDAKVPFRVCVWPFLTSIAVNNLLPLRVGDVVRVMGFRRELGLPVVGVLGTLVIERLLDLVVLLAFFFVGLLQLEDGVFPQGFVTAALWLSGGTLTVVLLYFLLAPWLEGWLEKLARRPFFQNRNLSAPLLRHGLHFTGALALVRSSSRLALLLLMSLVGWGFEAAVFSAVAAGLQTGVEPLGGLFSMASGTLATLLPSSPGYLGTFDYFAAKGLAAWGVSGELSVIFAFTVHAVLWLPLTSAGLIYLLLKGYRFWKLRPDDLLVSDDRSAL